MKYLVTLSPRGKFFFGGDRTFSSEERQSYYSHSTYFPQQTAVLGMLRFALLQHHGLLSQPADTIKSLVGATGFGLDATEYGQITNLSPVFIQEGEKAWISTGFDQQSYGNLSPTEGTEGSPQKMEGYDPKKWLEARYVSLPEASTVVSNSYFFTPISQVGNAKDRRGKSKQDAFFKQDHLDFKRDKDKDYQKKFAFAFELETTAALDLPPVSTVFLGAESVFSMKLSVVTSSLFDRIEGENNLLKDKPPASSKLVLLSDAYVSQLDALKASAGMIVTDGPIPFKFNKPKSADYYGKPDRSEQFQLLSRGTVIYPTDLGKICQLLEAETAFRTIGYNQYQIQTR
ncbi:MAG: hypothetical protein KKG00_09575 [Bacteroidetes bacterium]|nr:hypothetical protein [Bacteroidota bacterium]